MPAAWDLYDGIETETASKKWMYYITEAADWNVTSAQILGRITITLGGEFRLLKGEEGGGIGDKSKAKTEYREKSGLAGAAEGINPGGKDFVGGRLQIEELDAETDAGLDNAYEDMSFEDLALAGKRQTSTTVLWEGLAGANEAAAKGDVGSDAVHFLAGLHIREFRIGSERIADGVTPVSYARKAEGCGIYAIRHGDDFIHSKSSIQAETPRAPQGG